MPILVRPADSIYEPAACASSGQLPVWNHSRESARSTRPHLLDVEVGHAGDVIGDGARQTFGRDLSAMIGRQQHRVGDQRREQPLHHLIGMLMRLLHRRRVVHIGVEEGFGCGSFRLPSVRSEAASRVGRLANFVEGRDSCAGDAGAHLR